MRVALSLGKRCFKCERWLLRECFHAHFGMKDGRLNKCRQCTTRDSVSRRRERWPEIKEAYLAKSKVWRRNAGEKYRAQRRLAHLENYVPHPRSRLPDDVAQERARVRANAWYYANKERAQACTAAYRRAHPELQSKRARSYYEKNRAAVISRAALWAARNPKKASAHSRANSKKWRAANPEKVRLQKKAWKARRRAGGPLPPKCIKAVFAAWPECAFCRSKSALTLDHLLAVSKGGKNDSRNLVGACISCNSSKGATEWRSWLRKQKFFSVEAERVIDAYSESASSSLIHSPA